MDPITCACGTTYTPKDKTAIARHEATAKHTTAVTAVKEPALDDAFSDLDLDEPDDSTAEAWKILDKTEPAKAFTADERLSIVNSIAATRSALDPSLRPKEVAEAYVAATLDANPKMNEAILGDLQEYAKGVVEILRADAGIAVPSDPKPKRAKVVEKAKAVKATKPKASSSATSKVCRVCGKDKPLDEYGKKSSAPDGKQTLCSACAKAWTAAHKAKVGAK